MPPSGAKIYPCLLKMRQPNGQEHSTRGRSARQKLWRFTRARFEYEGRKTTETQRHREKAENLYEIFCRNSVSLCLCGEKFFLVTESRFKTVGNIFTKVFFNRPTFAFCLLPFAFCLGSEVQLRRSV